MAIHHQPVMLCLTCYVQGIYRTKVSCYQRVSGTKVFVCVWVGGLFYCSPEAASMGKRDSGGRGGGGGVIESTHTIYLSYK